MNSLCNISQPVSAACGRLQLVGSRRSSASRRQPGPASVTRSGLKPVGVLAERQAPERETSSSVQTVPVVFQCTLKVAYGEHLRVVGSHEVLGGWEVGAAPALEWGEGHVWAAQLELPVGAEVEYKFVHVMPNRTPVWEFTSNRSFTVAAATRQEVVTDWNNPVAHFEERTIEIQDLEALDMLEAMDAMPSGTLSPPAAAQLTSSSEHAAASPPKAQLAAELAYQATQPSTEPHFQEAANYEADVESMFGSMSTLEDVSAVLDLEEELAAVPADATAANGTAAAAVALPAAEDPTSADETSIGAMVSVSSSSSLLKSVGKTAGYVAMGVAAGALMSALTVDVAEMAVMGAVLAAAGNAALSTSNANGTSRKEMEDGAEGADLGDGAEEEGSVGRRRRPSAAEPGLFMAAAVLSAFDKVQTVLVSTDGAAHDGADAAVEEAED
ncbi:hypothetical protein N2152v2_005697 [Parachlorella kessleri]